MPLTLTTGHVLLRTVPFLAFALAGCSHIADGLDPVVGQLNRYQQARSAGNWQAITDEAPISGCQPVVEGCAKLYAIYGEANQHLAFASLAPNAFCPPPGINGRLNTAVASYTKSEQFGDASLAPAGKVSLKNLQAQALYCLAENASSIEQGKVFVRQSAEVATALSRADALFWQAMSQLYLARPGAGNDAQRCAAAHSADEAARAAQRIGVNSQQSQILDRVSHDADQLHQLIPGCTE